jgi:hypothetical protein
MDVYTTGRRNHMPELQFTPEQLLDQAQGNATAVTLATIAFFKMQGLALEQLVDFIGTQLARGWDTMREQGALNTMNFVVLNMVSLGATLESLTGDETHATAILDDWPPRQWLAYFGLTTQDVDAWADLFKPIAASLNFHYERTSDGSRIIYTLTRN